MKRIRVEMDAAPSTIDAWKAAVGVVQSGLDLSDERFGSVVRSVEVVEPQPHTELVLRREGSHHVDDHTLSANGYWLDLSSRGWTVVSCREVEEYPA